jgi:hypothetical protein
MNKYKSKLIFFIRESKENAVMIYRALAENYSTWRQAGQIVADLKGEGDYTDYYCSGREGCIKNRKVWKLLKKAGYDVLDGMNYTYCYLWIKIIGKRQVREVKSLFDLSMEYGKALKSGNEELAKEIHDKMKKKSDKLSKSLGNP